jgi:hypothetical protein
MKIVIKRKPEVFDSEKLEPEVLYSENFQSTGTGGSWISKFFKKPKPEVVIRNQITPNTDLYTPNA